MSSSECYDPIKLRQHPRPKARVCVIYTGGTIGAVPTDPDNPSSPNLRPASLDELLEAVPDLGESEGIELGLLTFRNPVDSCFVTKEHWIALAAAIQEHYDQFDGFVVLHGTDTMAFTTSALSFMLNNLAKPVVVTGSQRPIRDRRGDGVMNLLAAIQIAGYKATGLPCIPEVTLCFGDRLLRGNRATKISSERWQGFASPNFPSLGIVGERIKIQRNLLLPVPENSRHPFYADLNLASDVKIIFVNPGLTPQQFERDLKTEGLAGVILLSYGAGNFPGSQPYLDPLRQAIAGQGEFPRPIHALNVSQCPEGTVEMRLYEASGGLLEAGVASGDNLTLEAGLAKMYWALARFSGADVRAQLQIAQRGEQSQSLFDMRFDPGEHCAPWNATPVIEPSSQQMHGQYDSSLLKTATVRILGLGLRPRDPGRPAGFRLFINGPGAGEETPRTVPSLAGEYPAARVSRAGMFLATVTHTVQRMVDRGPTTVTLVGINADLWCRSIHLGACCE
jgi:L-asparaginase